jgi:hypothetical protein
VGKYYEFKNKYITLGKVGDKSKEKVVTKSSLSDKGVFKQVESFEESFETLSEEQLSGESDFHVIGTKETELINISENFKYQNEEILNSMSELESFDEGLKFVDEEEIEIETEAEHVAEEKISENKVFGFNDVYEETVEQKDKTDVKDTLKTSKDLKKLHFDDFKTDDPKAIEDVQEQKEEMKPKKKKTKAAKFKKGKLRFGFSDEEEKS